MRVSIVTTTLNALRYIVETTRSVLLTPHSDLEYLVVDAGSTDGTREFLLALQDHRLRVEILEGASQYEAIDWGLRHVTGEVVAWLNGDDLYLPWTITTVSRLFTEFPQVQWMTGLPTYIDGEGDCTMVANPSSYPQRYIRNGWFHDHAYGNLVQESMFWRRDLYFLAGGLNLKYELAADFELWTRFAQHAPLEAVNIPLTAWRKHAGNRSIVQGSAYLDEVVAVTSELPHMSFLKAWLCRHLVTRHALRLAEWHRTPWIFYSTIDACWRHGTAFRPISRYGIQQLKSEFAATRRQARKTSALLSAAPPS